jgi:cytochrome P450
MITPSAERTAGVPTDADLSLLRMLDSEVLANPYVNYRVLREHEPVHWDPYMHAWVVTSYREVLTVLLNYSADRTPAPAHLNSLGLSFMTPFSEMMLKQMMFMDGQAHSRLRSICAAAFTPRRVDELRTVIEGVAERLIDTFISSGEAELVADFANPLPALVTARLLGVPEEDHKQLHAWVLDLAEILGNFQHHPDRVVEIVRSMEELKEYIAARMEEQRDNPAGLIGSLMMAEVNGSRLTDEEVIANTIITLIGGHETTTNLITNGFLTLLREPRALEQLRSQPEIINSAVEELLRFESPVQHTARIAPADMELGGKTIKKGSRVVAVLAAGNRDPQRFPDPDRLDLLRTDNRHLAFGWAAHFCFGAPLARMEAQIAFNLLLKRLPKPVLLDSNLRWRENAGLRGLYALHIGFTRQSAVQKG